MWHTTKIITKPKRMIHQRRPLIRRVLRRRVRHREAHHRRLGVRREGQVRVDAARAKEGQRDVRLIDGRPGGNRRERDRAVEDGRGGIVAKVKKSSGAEGEYRNVERTSPGGRSAAPLPHLAKSRREVGQPWHLEWSSSASQASRSVSSSPPKETPAQPAPSVRGAT